MLTTEANWDNIADDFMQKWNFPNCVGAIDGKHVNLKNFNYKHSHSIVLLGLADANYQFTYINVGSAGRNSDGGVYVNSRLSKALENNSINILQTKAIARSTATRAICYGCRRCICVKAIHAKTICF
nr:unnamed protein product [Callosobruchus chinensis]